MHALRMHALKPASFLLSPIFSMSSDEEPIDRLTERRSTSSRKRAAINYADSENSSEPTPVKRSSKSKTVDTPPSAKKSVTQKGKTAKGGKVKKEESSENESDGNESVPDGMVVKSRQTKVRTPKEQLVAEILCRWWYCMPAWPPKDYDFESELHKRGFRKVSLDDWEDAHDVDDKKKTKCYGLSQFPGVFRDCHGDLVDCRPNEGKPSFNNLISKTEKELHALLNKALEGQLAQLGDADPELAKELKSKLKSKK